MQLGITLKSHFSVWSNDKLIQKKRGEKQKDFPIKFSIQLKKTVNLAAAKNFFVANNSNQFELV